MEFVILEDTSDIIDRKLGEVVLGKPFIEKSGAAITEEGGTIAFKKGNRKIASCQQLL